MIDRLIELSIRHRALVIIAGLVLALWGVYAFYHTPMDAIPDLSENQVIVFTDWMGHSPQELEDQVTYPLSLHLQGLAGVRVIRSSSDLNFSMINLIFEDGVEYQAARDAVEKRLAHGLPALPPGVTPRLGPDADATGQIFWYTVEGENQEPWRLRAIQDWYIRPQLQSVAGVAEVASVGGTALEYQVEVDPNRLLEHGVKLADLLESVARANAAAGGHVIQKGNAEFIVRSSAWLGATNESGADSDPQRVLRDLEKVLVPGSGATAVRISELARVSLGAQPRRGVLEKDGTEVTGGVVLMRHGDNPLEVTRRLYLKIQDLQAGLPSGVRIVPFYDRTPLIRGALGTVTGTLLEAILTATVCVLLILLHFRTSFVIVLTLPLAVLASFAAMWTLRRLGIADIQTNIMSMAGIAISIGILVDSSIVMAENAMHHLKEHFGDQPVRGDVRALVLPAFRTVGRPIFFSVLIMLLSFLPVFALGGMEGKMFRPLAFTKSFALLAVALLAVTLVPALCSIFIRGRLRGEMDSWIVRGVVSAYRPLLSFFLTRPIALAWFVGATFIAGAAPLGSRFWTLAAIFVGLVGCAATARRWQSALAAMVSLIFVALIVDQHIKPLGHEFMVPLDEGMVMDMPITVPRASITQSADDLKARDMVFCRFPEIDMVVGKAGRAETPTDPAPLDMIETMLNFRPPELWPKRKLRPEDAEQQAFKVLEGLTRRGMVRPAGDPTAFVNEALMQVLPVYDAQMREYAYQRNQEFERGLAARLVRFTVERMAATLYDNGALSRQLTASDIARLCDPLPVPLASHVAKDLLLEDVTQLAREIARRMQERGMAEPDADLFRDRVGFWSRGERALQVALGGTPSTFYSRLHDAIRAQHNTLWKEHVHALNGELHDRAAAVFTRLTVEELVARAPEANSDIQAVVQQRRRLRTEPPSPTVSSSAAGHHGGRGGTAPSLDPCPPLDSLQDELTRSFATSLLLWRKDRADLVDSGGELDRVMQMPGWTNVWTRPIQNRVDMLATGVNTTIGVRVLGNKLEDVVRASEQIAAVLKRVPGAADVVADPVRGKGYLEVRADRERAARSGVSIGDINDLVEIALAGKVATTTVEGRQRHAVRVRFARTWRGDEEMVQSLPVPARDGGAFDVVSLGQVADVRIVEGSATIKSENGLLRNYVRLNARGRDSADLVEEAQRVVAEQVVLPPGVHIEWTGQFEHETRARETLLVIVPLVLLVIFLILYWTYRDLADTLLMLVAVPGALAGGLLMQWLFGYRFSVTVWVGYIACFGMATSTGIIMLVYLREAVAKAGGLDKISKDQLRTAVMNGAVHRLRPKLLTEATAVFSLAPLLWTSGTGAEILKPMVVPVLGGILVADEVIDLFLPVLFYWVRLHRWERARSSPDI